MPFQIERQKMVLFAVVVDFALYCVGQIMKPNEPIWQKKQQ